MHDEMAKKASDLQPARLMIDAGNAAYGLLGLVIELAMGVVASQSGNCLDAQPYYG